MMNGRGDDAVVVVDDGGAQCLMNVGQTANHT